MIQIELSLPIPPSMNGAYRNIINGRGGRALSKSAREWKSRAEKALIEFHVKHLPLLLQVPSEARYLVKYGFVFPDSRRRDIANFEKLLSDFLVSSGYIIDDSKIDEMILTRIRPDKGNPRVEIQLNVQL